MQERVDLKERVEELEHRCIQLSGETDTIGEYIALYQSQRAILKQRHVEKEDYISRLAQDKEEMKVRAPVTLSSTSNHLSPKLGVTNISFLV
ncbi:hypothetical protein FKM82_005586 [Ascaphus truei]